jgi:MoaA/NifB/PqqE/SkfB family radical SAM enzyme
MPFEALDRIIGEARRLWGVRIVAFTGGEPLLYRSGSRGILDVMERHEDLLYLVFTNGTLIDSAVAKRFARPGGPTAAISVEGLEASTDARRGPGAFTDIMRAIDVLREAQAPAGISMTATRHNCEELLSDEFLDLFFMRKEMIYGFLFHYMPMGRDPDPALMPTPAQRLWLWNRSWEIIEKDRVPIFDFSNHGTIVGGCAAAGRGRGYVYIDWYGNVTPCVFAPYSACNIHDLHSRGMDLNDAWDSAFLRGIRDWQTSYRDAPGPESMGGRLVSACPVRDHHDDFRALVRDTQALPAGPTAASCLSDEAFSRSLIDYGRDFAELGRPVFDAAYGARPDGS